MNNSAQFVSGMELAVTLLAPVAAICWLRRWWVAIPVGAFLFWGPHLVFALVLNALDPTRDAGMLDAAWLALGWQPGLAYATLLWALRRGFLFLRNRRRAQSTPAS